MEIFVSNQYSELLMSKSRILRAAVKEGLNKKTSLFTFAYLKLPQKLVRSALDSSKWKIDFDVAPQGGPLIMANEIFESGSVSRTNTANIHVVVMGLGGGFISGYLHHHFPQMRITAVDISPTVVSMAKKWFSMETDNRYDIVVEDGVQYFRRCVEQGQRFDAILLDACSLDFEADFTCPVKVFLTEETISNMATLLGQRGVLTINFLARLKTLKDEVLNTFHKYFKYEKPTALGKSPNYIHTFTQFEPPRQLEDTNMNKSKA
ncbi:hypothetical protein KIN20_015529 [Parelaphostrongylus tenuis]|uniref:Uncharacterized protein n=1 Tax=Parelaphostrongylus tenuis TaxID=148309 RepID=A0AAD5MF31_PARTN|nr:hypothetical protein KIN20_015529 [Parelaphostrongylus tenuis]